jgi:hypothetical protein
MMTTSLPRIGSGAKASSQAGPPRQILPAFFQKKPVFVAAIILSLIILCNGPKG